MYSSAGCENRRNQISGRCLADRTGDRNNLGVKVESVMPREKSQSRHGVIDNNADSAFRYVFLIIHYNAARAVLKSLRRVFTAVEAVAPDPEKNITRLNRSCIRRHPAYNNRCLVYTVNRLGYTFAVNRMFYLVQSKHLSHNLPASAFSPASPATSKSS